MNINETLTYFNGLFANATQMKDIRIYKRFIELLTGLSNIELTEEEKQQIEEYIGELQLKANPERKHKYFTKKYAEFTNYLKTTFSLVTEGYYSAIGLSIGLSIGAGLGVTFGSIGGGTGISIGISMGAGIGMVIGMLVGASLDAEAKKNGKVIMIKTNSKT